MPPGGMLARLQLQSKQYHDCMAEYMTVVETPDQNEIYFVWHLSPSCISLTLHCRVWLFFPLLSNLWEIWTRPEFLRSSVIVSSGGWSPSAVAVTAYCSKGISKTSKRTSIFFSLVGMRRWVLNGISGQIVFLKMALHCFPPRLPPLLCRAFQ